MGLHSFSPHLHAIEPRGLLAREVAWHRIDQIDEAQARVTRHAWDEAGRSVADWDPRLWEMAATANSRKTPSLSGRALLDESVDAGWRLELSGADGQSVERWDGRGSYSRIDYDECLRPVSVTETLIDAHPNVVERFTYGDASALSAEHNQCGRMIRHDDPAGTWCAHEFGLVGGVLTENRRFLQTDEPPDWPLDSGQRDAVLEPGVGHTTTAVFDATAALIFQTDAVGNRTEHRKTVGGFLRETRLKLASAQHAQTLISDPRYNPNGQLESERMGNGVISEEAYEAETGRLTRIFSSRADSTVLQDLNYRYDPVGNIVEIEDAAQLTRFFANQRIDPVSRYRYDTLYQLIEASGREVATGASHGPALPALRNLPQDANQLSNYTQSYDYDAGGNLLEMRHVGAQPFTRRMQVDPNSNRSLAMDELDADFCSGFDANGNLLHLQRGQGLEWDLRNQLAQVTGVKRDAAADDDETYVYDGNDQRCRKVRSTRAKNRTLIAETRYLPGLEIRTQPNGEILHVCTTPIAHNLVHTLHWVANKPDGIENDQVRYNLNDHLDSSTLELNKQGGLISQEGYYPFGGTAWWAVRSATEAKYKTVRYSGKERDASGLYYYGFRYYAPWLMRWLNPDPTRHLTGLNAFAAMNQNPITYHDPDGRMPQPQRERKKSPKIRPALTDDTYKRLADKDIINPIQARGMAPIRNYWGSRPDLSPAAAAYREAIPEAIQDLSAQGRKDFRVTGDAHILAAVRTDTSRPSGAVMYHGGEIISGTLNTVVGEKMTSKVMGPLSDIFNGPDRPQEELDRNRQVVSSTFKIVGGIAMHSPNPVVQLAGAIGVATGNGIAQTEVASAALYGSLKRSASRPSLIRSDSATSSSPSSPVRSRFNFASTPTSTPGSTPVSTPESSLSRASGSVLLSSDGAPSYVSQSRVFGLSTQELLDVAMGSQQQDVIPTSAPQNQIRKLATSFKYLSFTK
ncbi:RHS repeat-associated core domain-containing protein [Pseudomonas sp. RC10]|uniref:RHS repeat domain-containing protein n=1 Tax=Pseudomonas bambusae TaxID=3139142 RepID=UPI003139D53F